MSENKTENETRYSKLKLAIITFATISALVFYMTASGVENGIPKYPSSSEIEIIEEPHLQYNKSLKIRLFTADSSISDIVEWYENELGNPEDKVLEAKDNLVGLMWLNGGVVIGIQEKIPYFENLNINNPSENLILIVEGPYSTVEEVVINKTLLLAFDNKF